MSLLFPLPRLSVTELSLDKTILFLICPTILIQTSWEHNQCEWLILGHLLYAISVFPTCLNYQIIQFATVFTILEITQCIILKFSPYFEMLLDVNGFTGSVLSQFCRV